MIYRPLTEFLEIVKNKPDEIPHERKASLRNISEYISVKMQSQDSVNLIFICTHNSRRSIMAQLWAQLIAAYYKISNVNCFSGGTQVTSFNDNAVAVLINAGFNITLQKQGENPVYNVMYATDMDPIIVFSKQFTGDPNPKEKFIAILTCSDADNACPFVPSADVRISIPYEDPKEADGTDNQDEKYNDVSRQICREIMFVFSLLESKF